MRLSRNVDQRVVKFDVERFFLSFLSLEDYGQYTAREDRLSSIYLEPVDVSKNPTV